MNNGSDLDNHNRQYVFRALLQNKPYIDSIADKLKY